VILKKGAEHTLISQGISRSARLRPSGLASRLGRNNFARYGLKFLAVLILLFVGVSFASPQASQPSEYQLKAAFLFSFAKFIDWPDKSFATPQSPFMLCVIGQDPFGGALDEYLAKTMDGRAVQVAHFPSANVLSGARHCQITFVSASEKLHFRDVVESLKGTSGLLVGDADGFVAAGGMIEFTLEDNHVRFAINPDAALRADLKVSSKLLALAKIVHNGSN
jgi:hypothetical protein